MRGNLVEIRVGDINPITYYVHEEALCAASPFFKSALSHDWKEAEQRCVHLKEEEPEVFDLYLQWVYRAALPLPEYVADEQLLENNSQIPKRDDQLQVLFIRSYVLGDRLQDDDFMDAVTDAIIDLCIRNVARRNLWHFFPPKGIRFIYENSLDSCKLRRFIVDLHVYHVKTLKRSELKLANEDELPKAFLYDIAKRFIEGDGPDGCNPLVKSETCKYHKHGNDMWDCYKLRYVDYWARNIYISNVRKSKTSLSFERAALDDLWKA